MSENIDITTGQQHIDAGLDAPKKSRKPSNYAFTQQRLRAWQPILRPPYVIATFLLLTVVFIPLGVVLLLASKSVIEHEITYAGHNQDVCVMARSEELGGAMYCNGTREFIVQKRMNPPIYIYYKLQNFYQNHRRYADSRSDKQLGGKSVSTSDLESSCKPILYYGPNSKKNPAPKYNPCGLIAWSMFNDTFTLYNVTNGVKDIVCDTKTQQGCTKKNIAWASDRNVKFNKPSNPNLNTTVMYPRTYYNESTHVIPDVEDEDFIVWMRTAALPNFRKLHRIIKTPINPGNYILSVEQNYPVKEFGGVKSLVITTSSWIGGRNYFLAISYLVVGSLTFTLAAVFSAGGIISFIIKKIKGTA
jgi:hypothetical protein